MSLFSLGSWGLLGTGVICLLLGGLWGLFYIQASEDVKQKEEHLKELEDMEGNKTQISDPTFYQIEKDMAEMDLESAKLDKESMGIRMFIFLAGGVIFTAAGFFARLATKQEKEQAKREQTMTKSTEDWFKDNDDGKDGQESRPAENFNQQQNTNTQNSWNNSPHDRK